MKWMRAQGLGLSAAFVGALLLPCLAWPQTAPHIVVVVAEGTGFPFEDPGVNLYPALRKLRLGSRPFDSIFTSDASWTGTGKALKHRSLAAP